MWKELHALLETGRWPARLAHGFTEALLEPRYNVAPSQHTPIVRAVSGADGEVAALEVSSARWGLAPHWAKDARSGPINARAETVATNGMFRAAFASRRCIVPVSGFYEWKQTTDRPLFPGAPAEKGPKQPFHISRADGRPLLLAGLYERWGKGEECVDTFAIITTGANDFMSAVHDRMPAVLEPESVRDWLDPRATPDQRAALLRPAPAGVLEMHAVSARVNNPRNQGPELLEAL